MMPDALFSESFLVDAVRNKRCTRGSLSWHREHRPVGLSFIWSMSHHEELFLEAFRVPCLSSF
jgi:hypothetical protein